MDTEILALEIATGLEDKLGLNIIILDVEALVGYASHFVIASGRSERQVQALAEHIKRKMKADHDVRPLSIEGTQAGKWALVDFGDVVVHIFREDERDFYDLEGLWRDAPRVERTVVAQAAQ
jgi:ribosome-associated protein